MYRWIFGYGSLIWRPDFAFQERRVGFIEGWQRRLEQGSPDHRGTPERLGRVATLVRAEGARCGGVAYLIEESARDTILANLDIREQGGYERVEVAVTLAEPGATPVRAITWVARPENPYYLGPAPVHEMAAQIRVAVGPSGHNADYVARLAEMLRALEIDDPHIFELSAAIYAHAEAASGPR